MIATRDDSPPFPHREDDLGLPAVGVGISDNTDFDVCDRTSGFLKSEPPALPQVLPLLLYELASRLPALPSVHPFCAWLRQPERQAIRLYLLMAGLPEAFRAANNFPLDERIADWVWQKQSALIIGTEQESRFPAFARQLLMAGIKSFCAMPLTIADRRIGVFGLVSTQREAFRNLDPDLFQHSVARLADATSEVANQTPVARLDPPNSTDQVSLVDATSTPEEFQGIIGHSSAMRHLRSDIQVVAPTGSTVLILGETGTGKELIARAIHNLGSHSDGPFIKVNCAAIPAGLIESELFGHERGSFTGAVGRRIGRFEMANGGTLFLDEIGDIPLELQPKLLRVLQEQEFERIGSTQTIRVKVRIVAATSRDLPTMVAKREFRCDLYYRLNVFPLRVPPLRERAGDIALLVGHFVDHYARRMNKSVSSVSSEAMEAMLNYSWPGNVRELQNVIERAVILSTGTVLHPPLTQLRHAPAAQAESPQVIDGGHATLRLSLIHI